jgi:formate dehydrogenase major subunit
LFVMGQNPAVGSQHAGLQRRALAKLKWLVVRDMAEIETATFWRDSPEVQSGELRPEAIQTEVFLMPAASHIEKEGTFTNTQRLVQFRDKALSPPGDARSELWFMHHLAKRVKAHYAGSERERDWPIVNLKWDYPERAEVREPDVEAVIKEINGYDVATGMPVGSFDELRSDGSTACGCWIYSGIYEDGVNQARRRRPGDLAAEGGIVSPEWAWAWPANRRILYNRASADPQGRPWSERKRYVWWDEEQGRWAGYDVPDFPAEKRPDYQPKPDARAMDAIGGADPFMMMSDGRGWLYSPSGLLDGPLPTFLRAGRVADAEPALPQDERQPGRDPLAAAGEPIRRSRRPGLPGGGNDLPADRASHGRGYEPHGPVAGGAAARDVRRDRSAARRRPGDRGRRLDDDRDRAGGDRGAGQSHRADPAAAGGRAGDPPDRPPLALGLRRTLAR